MAISNLTLTVARQSGRDSVELPGFEIELLMPSGQRVRAPLDLNPVVVGSSPECELVAIDPAISRRHCMLSIDAHGLRLQDLNSKNGTFIGHTRIRDVLLDPTTVVQIGGSKLALVEGPSKQFTLSQVPRFGEAVGASLVMRALFSALEKVSPTSQPVLLLGDSGTGKELLARAIHENSPRRAGPFVVLDCGTIAPELIESQLFGHEVGAFTGATEARGGIFQEADGGTLFIDDIGSVPLELQSRLLRALESKQVRRLGATSFTQVDVRVIASAHSDLKSQVQSGTFRQDLYFRVAIAELRVPPLRERKEDIPLLVEAILAQQQPPRALSSLPPNAIALLSGHDWPGNIRELRNAVTRLVLLPDVTTANLEAQQVAGPFKHLLSLSLADARDQVVTDFERHFVEAKLEENGGNVSGAARAMGVSRQIVHRLIRRYGLRGGDDS